MLAITAARRTKPKSTAKESPRFDMHRFTVEQYQAMGEARVLGPEHRVELLDGWIVRKPMQRPRHAQTYTRLHERIRPLLPDHCLMRLQLPITLANSEPEPDVVVASGPDTLFDDRHPSPGEIQLLVEIADSSLPIDQGTKLTLYAEADIPVYWIVNIPNRRVEVYTQPRNGKKPGYRRCVHYGRGGVVPIVVGGKKVGEILVSDLKL